MAARTLIVSLILLASPARGRALCGFARERPEWQLERSPLRCLLRQPVPCYGEAVFETRAGERQSFTLRTSNNPMMEGPTALVAVAPQWNPNRVLADFGTIDVAAGTATAVA